MIYNFYILFTVQCSPLRPGSEENVAWPQDIACFAKVCMQGVGEAWKLSNELAIAPEKLCFRAIGQIISAEIMKKNILFSMTCPSPWMSDC